MAGTASLKKVPGARVRVPLPRHEPEVQGVGAAVPVVAEVTMEPPEHCETREECVSCVGGEKTERKTEKKGREKEGGMAYRRRE